MMQSPQSDRPIFGKEPGKVGTPCWVADWKSDPTTYRYKGGDLFGLVDHSEYLVDLAATAFSYAFKPRLDNEAVVVALNTSNCPDRIALPENDKLEQLMAVGDLPDVEATNLGMEISLPAWFGGLWVMTHDE